jgi:hypothetical protein
MRPQTKQGIMANMKKSIKERDIFAIRSPMRAQMRNSIL